MSFNNNYEHIYNLTFGAVQNTCKNIYTNIVEMNIDFDFMLYTNLIQYEHYLFEWCIYLLKYSLYYIFFFMIFEFVSKIFANIYIYSSVTRGYIKKYNRLQRKIEMLYFEMDKKDTTIEELNIENDKLYDDYNILREHFFHTKTETDDKSTQSDIDTDDIPSINNNILHKRTASKKASKTIKELVKKKLV